MSERIPLPTELAAAVAAMTWQECLLANLWMIGRVADARRQQDLWLERFVNERLMVRILEDVPPLPLCVTYYPPPPPLVSLDNGGPERRLLAWCADA